MNKVKKLLRSRAIGGDYLKKPTDDLESLTIDEFHDWAVIVKKAERMSIC